jgi:hypothetical protein
MVTHALIDCILYVRHDSYGDPDFADTFTLSGISEAENTSSSLPKPLDISGQLFSSIPSQYLHF